MEAKQPSKTSADIADESNADIDLEIEQILQDSDQDAVLDNIDPQDLS